MKPLISAVIVLFLFNSAYAQKTQIEKVRRTNEYDDSKPNSDEVPDVYGIPTDFERVVLLRFKHKTDLLAGLEKAAKEQDINNGVILAGIGSVRSYHIHMVSNRDFPSRNYYVKDPTGEADLLSMNGYIIDGRVHAHLTLSDDEKAFGGHLEPGTTVFTFSVVTVGVLPDDLDLSRVDDKTHR